MKNRNGHYIVAYERVRLFDFFPGDCIILQNVTKSRVVEIAFDSYGLGFKLVYGSDWKAVRIREPGSIFVKAPFGTAEVKWIIHNEIYEKDI